MRESDAMSSTYRVLVQRDEAGYWIGTVPELPGTHIQVTRLDEMDQRAREVIALRLDVPGDSFEVDIVMV